MRARILVLSLIATAVAAVPLAAAPAEAAVPTCFGKKATVVGRGDAVVRGTRQADVIVVLGRARSVDAGPGDDLICVQTGQDAWIDAGAGDDRVRGSRGRNDVELGRGADWFRGGPGADTVFGNAYGKDDDDRDVIRTGGGADEVRASVDSGRRPFLDVVALGAGRDSLEVHGYDGFRGRVSFGSGEGLLAFSTSDPRRLTVDNVRGEIRAGRSRQLSWSGTVSRLDVAGGPPVDVVGSRRPERFFVPPGGTVRAGAGDDKVVVGVTSYTTDAPSTTVAGGAGLDRLVLDRYDGRTVADLTGRITGPWGGPITSAGFEDLVVASQELVVRGTDATNDLRVSGCAVTVDAGGGDDTVSAGFEILASEGGIWWEDCAYDVEARGGAGDDVITSYSGDDQLSGDAGDDRLVAGDGTDSADGGDGADRCFAETTTACER
jgi:Ca2+-binding RTX toxin-like protein